MAAWNDYTNRLNTYLGPPVDCEIQFLQSFFFYKGQRGKIHGVKTSMGSFLANTTLCRRRVDRALLQYPSRLNMTVTEILSKVFLSDTTTTHHKTREIQWILSGTKKTNNNHKDTRAEQKKKGLLPNIYNFHVVTLGIVLFLNHHQQLMK